MNYSTLQEAYNIDSFGKSNKNTVKKQHSNDLNIRKRGENETINNQGPSHMDSNKKVLDNDKIIDYNQYMKNMGGSCAPLQAPSYTVPISGECKKELKKVMDVYTQENFNTVNNYDVTDIHKDNVMPYYDEELEQYFDINNLVDEVKYNSNMKKNQYMPNTNKNSYTNNNTGEYSNNNELSSFGNNLLSTKEYNLSDAEKIKANEALLYLKNLEAKINNDEKNAILNQINESNDMGKNGHNNFYKHVETITPIVSNEIKDIKENKVDKDVNHVNDIKDNNDSKYNYMNTIITFLAFLLFGILIIFLCDYIVETSIQIGMKRTVNILEPYIRNQMPSQNNLYNQMPSVQSYQAPSISNYDMTLFPRTTN
jgi:hypothetical protein